MNYLNCTLTHFTHTHTLARTLTRTSIEQEAEHTEHVDQLEAVSAFCQVPTNDRADHKRQ